MSNLNTTPVIVVTEEKKRRRGLIWVAAGAAVAVVAAGGGTFALWGASATFDGGTITAGDLNLRAVDDTAYYDISPDRTDVKDIKITGDTSLKDTTKHLDVTGVVVDAPEVLRGHEIDLATWRIVPGDTIALVAETEITLIGDNLVAELSVDPGKLAVGAAATGAPTLDESGDPRTDNDGFDKGLTYTYTLFDADGDVIPGYNHVPMADAAGFSGHLAYFSASGDGQAAGASDAEGSGTSSVIDIDTLRAAGSTVAGVAQVTVVIEAAFPDTDERDDVGAAEALGSMELSLSQLRAGSEAIDTSTGIGANQKF